MIRDITQSRPDQGATNLIDGINTDLRLRFRSGQRTGQVIRISAKKCTIGSSPDCTLRLVCPGIQAVHCLIVRGKGGMAIRRWSLDTFLNGNAFTDAPLLAGDRLTIGPVEFEVLTETTSSRTGRLDTLPATAGPSFLDRATGRISKLERRIEQRRNETEALIAELRALSHEVEQARHQWHTTQRAPQSESADHYRAKLSELESLMAHQRQAYDQDRQAWLEQCQQIASSMSAQTEAANKASSADLDGRFRDVLAGEQALSQQQQELEQARRDFDDRVREWEHESEQGRDRLEQGRQELERERKAWSQQRDDEQIELDRRAHQLEEKSKTLQRDLESFHATQSQQAADQHEREQGLEQELVTLRANWEELTQQHEGLLASQNDLRQQFESTSDEERVASERQWDEQRAQLESQLCEKESELTALQTDRERERSEAEEQLSSRQTEIDAQWEQLRSEQAIHEQMRVEWESQREASDAALREFSEERQRLLEEFEHERTSFQSERDAWDGQRRQLDDELIARRSELDEQLRELQERQREFEEQAQSTQGGVEAIENQQAVFQQQRDEWESHRNQLEAELTTRRGELDEQLRALEERQRQFEEQTAASERIEDEALESERSAFEAERENWDGQRQQMDEELAARRHELDAKFEELRQQQEHLESQLSQSDEQADQGAALQARIEEFSQERETLQAKIEGSEVQRQELEGRLAEFENERAQTKVISQEQQYAQKELQTRLEEAEQERETAENQLEEARRQLENERQAFERDRAEFTATPAEAEAMPQLGDDHDDLEDADPQSSLASLAVLVSDDEREEDPSAVGGGGEVSEERTMAVDMIERLRAEALGEPLDAVEQLFDSAPEEPERSSDEDQDEELIFTAPEEIAPVDTAAILAKFGHVVEDDLEEPSMAPPPRIHDDFRSEDEKGESDINDYMTQLMQRVGSGTTAKSANPEPKTERNSQPAKKMTPARVPTQNVDTTPMDPSEFVPRNVAPEASSNLKALRAVANSSARSAINTHQKKRYEQLSYIYWFIFIVSLMVGGTMAAWSKSVFSISALAAGVSILVCLFAASQALANSGKSRFGSKGDADSDDNEQTDAAKPAPLIRDVAAAARLAPKPVPTPEPLSTQQPTAPEEMQTPVS